MADIVRRRMIGLLALSSLVAACGSDGRVAQPEDDFLDKVEAECRTASKGIAKLDVETPDADVIDQIVELLGNAVDVWKDLEAPQALEKDFDNMVSGVDDQASEARKLSSAIAADDAAATEEAAATIAELGVDVDKAANSLGALRCTALTPAEGLGGAAIPTDTIPTASVPIEPPPETVPPSDATTPDTTPETTPDTTPDTTPTTDPAEIFPVDLDLTATAPPGYTWVTDYIQTDIANLYGTSVLGPLVVSYAAAQLENTSDLSTASVYVMKISAEWTDEAIDQYYTWEVVNDGNDVTTPGGLAVRQMLLAFPNTDCLAYPTGTTGIAVCTYTGIDGLPILDAYIAANPI